MRNIVSVLVLISIISMLTGCGTVNKTGNEVHFNAMVLQINNNIVTVEPVGGEDILRSSDRITFSNDDLDDINVSIGDIVTIKYTGDVMETYPAQIIVLSWSIVKIGKLPAVEIKDNYISPDDGINIDVAKELVVKYLTENEYKGDIASSIEIKEITVEQAWENDKMQLYSIELDYAWLYGIAVISEGEVIGVLPGMPTISVYLADINDDFKYEVCTNALFGSGIIDMRIHVLDTQNLKQYELSKRFEYDLVLGIDDKALVIYRDDAAIDEKILLGRLLLEDGQLLIAEE